MRLFREIGIKYSKISQCSKSKYQIAGNISAMPYSKSLNKIMHFIINLWFQCAQSKPFVLFINQLRAEVQPRFCLAKTG
jgi:hypothetical protein